VAITTQGHNMTTGAATLGDATIAAPQSLDFRRLFESAPGLFLVLTPELRIVAVSDAYLRATLTERDAIVGQLFFDALPDNPDARQAEVTRHLRASFERVLRTGTVDTMAVQRLDIRRPASEGGGFEERFWSPINSPVFDAGGKLCQIIHRVEDVTEYVLHKQQLDDPGADAEEMRQRVNQIEAEIHLRAKGIHQTHELLRNANDILMSQVGERLAAERRVEAIAEELRMLNRELEERVDKRTVELADVNRALSQEIDERHCVQEHLRMAIEAAPYAMVLVDHGGLITLVNRKTEELFGYERSELLGASVETLVPERFRGEHPNQVAGYLNNPAARAMGAGRDLYGRHRDGSEFPVEIGLNPLRTAEGLFVLSAIVDITERKRAQEAVRQSELRFRGIFNQTFGLIGLLKPDGELLEVNQPALDFRGLTQADVVGRALWETPWFDISSEVREETRQAVRQAAAGVLVRRELTIQDGQGGVRTFDHTLKPVTDGAGVVQLVISEGRDITDQIKMEHQFRQAQKMEAVGMLAGGIAHEFNNLLQAVCGYTKLALEGLPPVEQPYQDLQLVLRSADRATALTRQLLSFGRRQVLERTQVDPNQVVVDLVKMLRPLIGENIEVRTLLATELSAIDADAGQLQQVLLNLCINARDAMPAGGRLTLRSQQVSLSEEFCACHPGTKVGRYVLLSVADTGSGMTADVRARIFEPFFTTKEPGRGTGLGLAMVYGMVVQHGGIIDVYSEPQLGTTFKLYLPIAGDRDLAHDECGTQQAVGGQETILVAEDEPMVRDLAVRILSRAGYTVLQAADGAEAVELFRDHVSEISLAVLDAVMPKLTGHQAYERIRLENPQLPVVFCSGYDPETGQVKPLVEQGMRMVQKPFDPEVLLRVVREVLDASILVEAF
jgi:PAS domain S-box-containing protein